MGRGVKFGVPFMPTGNSGQIHIVNEVVHTQSGIELKCAKAVVHLSIAADSLTAIIERSIEVVLPNETLAGKVPIADAVVTFLAIIGVLGAQFEYSLRTVVQLIGKSTVAIPMMLGFVTARSFHSFACQIEHIALGIFLREAVVPQAVRKTDLIAPFI